jgi:3-oxoadipate enol-lactonase
VHLPGRGTTWVWEAAGPPGAPTLLLLHGWTATAALNWFKTFEPLARRFHVVAMDVRGHGRGIRSRRPFRLTDCADDAAALCDELDLEPVVAVGYSMGGPIAQLLWDRHPDRVAGLVLCATAGVLGSRPPGPQLPSGQRPVSSLIRVTAQGMALGASLVPADAQRELARRVMHDRLAGSPLAEWSVEERSRVDVAALIRAGLDLARYNAREILPRIDVPVAVVETENDLVVSPRRQERMAAAIPHARVFPIAADHAACVEAADLFVPALLAACDDVTRRIAAAGTPPLDEPAAGS